ncbi:MAG: metal-dependent transcriptional regulator [Nitrospinae bacterium]|nr:metal-dependent transcriptional regulator [Nitrospinota bacterium]
MKQEEKDQDEILELIWTCKESGKQGKDEINRLMKAESLKENLYKELIEMGFIEEKGNDVFLTGTGEDRARRVIRQHRLAEVLVTNVLGVAGDDMEKSACAFEHSLVPEITEGICTLLGHPKSCPHGKPIPKGACCDDSKEHHISEAIIPLTAVKMGQEVKVSYLNSSQEKRLHYLSSIGVNPGATVKLHQTYPSFVIECGNTQIAMEDKIAEDIYVWKHE